MRYLWMTAGFAFLSLGTLGMFLPILPTVVFWILAAFAFSRSSDTLHNWMMTHPKIGPPLVDWYESGAISRKGKRAATIAIGITFTVSVILGLRFFVLAIQFVVLAAVLAFIWTRPDA